MKKVLYKRTLLYILTIQILSVFIMGCADNTAPYTVRKVEVTATNQARIYIGLEKEESAENIRIIAKKESSKYPNQRKIWIFFYTPWRKDCYATSHSSDNYEVKFLFQGI